MSTETLKSVADATLQQPVSLEVDIRPTNRLHFFLQKWGVLPKKRVLVISPIVTGSLIRISKILVDIDVTSMISEDNILHANYEGIVKYADKVIEIIAIAATNTEHPASKSLQSFIKRNFTALELMKVTAIVIRQMNVPAFLNTIISMKGLNVLQESPKSESEKEVSLPNQGSSIAPGIS